MTGDQRESAIWHGDLGSVQQHSCVVAEAIGDDDIGRAIDVETANSGRIRTVAHRKWADKSVVSASSAQEQIGGVIGVVGNHQICNTVSVEVGEVHVVRSPCRRQ